jgi:hypothetical protein
MWPQTKGLEGIEGTTYMAAKNRKADGNRMTSARIYFSYFIEIFIAFLSLWSGHREGKSFCS